MLTEWVLENFKPIGPAQTLELKRLTVLAGRNSSGKSSLLQSMLALGQTLSSPISDRPLLLNGSAAQLGSFDSVRNDQARDAPIRIGFSLALPDQHRPRRQGYPGLQSALRSVKVLASFQPAAGNGADQFSRNAEQASLVDTTLTVTVDSAVLDEKGEGGLFDVVAATRPMGARELEAFLANVTKEFSQRMVPYPLGRNYKTTIDWVGPKEFLTHLAHFVPDRLVGVFDVRERAEAQARGIAETLSRRPFASTSHAYYFGVGPFHSREDVDEARGRPVSAETRTQLAALIESGPLAFAGQTLGELAAWKAYPPIKRKLKKRGQEEVMNLLVQEILGSRQPVSGTPKGLETVTDAAEAVLMDAAVTELTRYLTSMLRYLGPLRAAPKNAQGFAPSGEADDVGSDGEHAAAVYEANRSQRIQWWNPETERVEEGTLEAALDGWARYIGLAHHITTPEPGPAGPSWVVQQREDSTGRPLTAVGVGTSQLLPVLVAGLMAPRDSLFLIEQPELHLHPRAQARLGDYFLGLVRTGKQCIVETHSDCLVNQLRYRFVKDGAAVRDAVAIYFADQDKVGTTTFSPVKISASGQIINWPDGFFDESSLQSDRIAHEVVSKRSRQQSE